jgi:Butirosin biosynthesis protein H, N-terminal/Domain of unknown function (DUF4872)
MTESKHLKARIRARMARTGERYMTARRQVVGEAAAPGDDHGWRLRGGVHPDSAAIATVLAHDGASVSEAMVLGVGGGLGAGYILWEFESHGTRTLVLGFRNAWQYPDRWASKVLERLGVPFAMHETSGTKGAAARLDAALAAGRPALVTVDRAEIGYWHLPASHSGRGGYPVVVHAIDGDRVRIDDRNLAPLSVPRKRLDAARARVVSYKHRLVVMEPAAVDEETLRAAVRAGLDDAVEHLGARSDSFGLPAWRKWARMLVDTRGAKAWPNVFADQRGLAGALLSAYEGIEPVGSYGGHLRGLYADFLDEAAALLDDPRLGEAASVYRVLAERWHALAELVLPGDVPQFAALREELAAVHESVVARGDAGADEAAAAAERLWALRAELDAAPPVEPDFVRLSEAVTAIYEAEVEAAARIKG